MSTLFSLFGHGLFLMALILFLVRAKSWGKHWPFAYLVAAVLIVLPVGSWLTIEFSRGYFGDLSVATLFMCGLYIANVARGNDSVDSKNRLQSSHGLKLFVIIVSVLFFPAALGMTQFDPFALGYASTAGFELLLVVIAVVSLAAWYLNQQQLALYLGLVLLTFGLQIYESNNVWNYLIDPIAMIMCIGSYIGLLIKTGYGKVFKKVSV